MTWFFSMVARPVCQTLDALQGQQHRVGRQHDTVRADRLDPAEHTDFRRDPRGQLPMHRAHYVTLRIPNGRTPDGLPIGLQPRSGVRLTGYLVDVAYPESLHQILTWLRLSERQREDDRERKLQQVLTYVIPRSLVRFGSMPYSQVSA